MSRSLFLPLSKKLLKIYFSNNINKEYEYKKTIFYALKDMGGVYIKFLQTLSVIHSFMDGWSTPKEYEVFNRVQLERIDLNKYITNKDEYLYIEDKPFASGPFAQLYKARLKNNEQVAIKVLRPSITRNLESDLLKLKRIIKIFTLFISNSVIDYNQAFEEFSRTCLLETDYTREIANMEYFYNMYKDHEYVVIPKVYKRLSTNKMIVQDYIEGPTLADLMVQNKPLKDLAYNLTGSDIYKQISIVGGEALRTAMCEDYVFGDPHPGNIILLKDNKIALIDFGIIANKPSSHEAFYLWTKSYYDSITGNPNYSNLLQATYNCFCPDLANALKKCNLENDFLKTLSKAIEDKAKIIENDDINAYKGIQSGHLVQTFIKFVDNKNALNINLDTRNFQLLKAMQSFLSSVTTIDNKYGNNDFSNIMKDSMKYALDYVEEHGIKRDMNNNTRYTLNEGYELLMDTLSSLAEGDEYLFNNISERMFL